MILSRDKPRLCSFVALSLPLSAEQHYLKGPQMGMEIGREADPAPLLASLPTQSITLTTANPYLYPGLSICTHLCLTITLNCQQLFTTPSARLLLPLCFQ